VDAKSGPDECRETYDILYEEENIHIHADVFVITGYENRQERELVYTSAHPTNLNSSTLRTR